MAIGATSDVSSACDLEEKVNIHPETSDCNSWASLFQLVQHPDSRSDNDNRGELFTGSFLQYANSYSPLDDVSTEIEKHVADKVNHVSDNGM